jgi:hypothetical protein
MNGRCPRCEETRQELHLGVWAGNLRSRAAVLSPERVEQLSVIGMWWLR